MKKVLFGIMIMVGGLMTSCTKEEVAEINQVIIDTVIPVNCNCGVITTHHTTSFEIPNTPDLNTVGNGYDPGTHLEYRLYIYVRNNCTGNYTNFTLIPNHYSVNQNMINQYYQSLGGGYCSGSQW